MNQKNILVFYTIISSLIFGIFLGLPNVIDPLDNVSTLTFILIYSILFLPVNLLPSIYVKLIQKESQKSSMPNLLVGLWCFIIIGILIILVIYRMFFTSWSELGIKQVHDNISIIFLGYLILSALTVPFIDYFHLKKNGVKLFFKRDWKFFVFPAIYSLILFVWYWSLYVFVNISLMFILWN